MLILTQARLYLVSNPAVRHGTSQLPGALQSNSHIFCFNSIFARRVQDKSCYKCKRHRERSLRKKNTPDGTRTRNLLLTRSEHIRRQTPYPLGYGGPQDISTLHIAIKTTFRHTTRKRVIQEHLKILSQQPFLSVKGHVTGCSDLVDLWIRSKKPMILCARSKSRSSGQSATKNGSNSENM